MIAPVVSRLSNTVRNNSGINGILIPCVAAVCRCYYIAVVLEYEKGPLLQLTHAATSAFQVVGDCGKLALSLGLAAPLLKGPPQDPKSWRTLHEALHDALTTRLGTDRIMIVPERVDAVLEVSLCAMADDPDKRKRCLFLAVLAPGTLAPSDMLQDLWNEVRRRGVAE